LIGDRIRAKDKRDRTFAISVVPLLEQVIGNVRPALLVLLGSVALVLLIACANVANLLLSRAARRQKEVAIRTALGAGWLRLLAQLLTESLLLGVAGGAAGLLIAEWSLRVARAMHPGNIPRMAEIGIDGRVLLFTFAISIVTGIVFGIAPALQAAKVDLNTSLKAGGRSSQGDGGLSVSQHRLRGLLVVSELALSLMLLIAAGLLLRSFARLQAVPPGFNPDQVLSMMVQTGGPAYRPPQARVQFFKTVRERIANLPGVKAVGGVTTLPFAPGLGWGGINVEGFTPLPGQELQVDQRIATVDYFRAMEIPLRQGRFFEDRDTPDSPPVVLIDEKFAQRFWPHESAIDKHVWFDVKKPMTIVGVVGTVKQYGLDVDGKIVVYLPHAQNAAGRMYMVARTSSDPSSMAGAMAREIHAVDRDVPIYQVRSMQERLGDSLARQRFSTTMLGAFALFALVLAMVGVYGVMSYLVTQGTHDIGVRIALGAQRGNILGMVVGRGMQLAVIGVGAGLLGAVALTRLMSSLLFGTTATDPVTFSAVSVILLAIALLATYIPARRATRVDPMVALREE
jgi:predicted permease